MLFVVTAVGSLSFVLVEPIVEMDMAVTTSSDTAGADAGDEVVVMLTLSQKFAIDVTVTAPNTPQYQVQPDSVQAPAGT